MPPELLAALAQYGKGFSGGLNQFLGGMFGNTGKPYEKAMGEWDKYLGQGINTQNPFYGAGVGAIPKYQNWADSMKDPSGFINNLMGQYQESPWAKYQQKQATRAATNFGSGTGLTGSTPLMQQAQENAANISSGDMKDWLSKVLGINTEYGAAEKGLMGQGQESANAITEMLKHFGDLMGEGAWNKERGKQIDNSNLWSGLLHMFMGG